ncbi:MAG: hypothetical protein CMO80_14160 [Verrucomicrobiales bacterium]|nr:hypothetical protein [Verrucomicrobiales bacterium]
MQPWLLKFGSALLELSCEFLKQGGLHESMICLELIQSVDAKILYNVRSELWFCGLGVLFDGHVEPLFDCLLTWHLRET